MASRTVTYLAFAFVLLGSGLRPSPAAQRPSPSSETDLLVQFTGLTPASRREAILSSVGASSRRRFDHLNADLAVLAPGRSMAAALGALARYSEVVAAQPDFEREAVGAAANDPYWLNGSLWGLERIGARETWAEIGTGGTDVVIADIDTGVNYQHPDLGPNMWRNPGELPGNGVDDDVNGHVDDVFGIDAANGDSDPMDDHGHGTHTAGTFAAAGNNGVGVTGVNWNAKILACKFLKADGRGLDSGAVACFNYIAALKQRGVNVRVTSNSWGDVRSGPASVLKNAIDAVGALGIVNVFAAGNDGTNNDIVPFDPASMSSSSIVSVAASDGSDNRAGFSNYGASSVDLAAPGVSILSTTVSGYGYASGTSMAAPHVAGAAALLASIDPSLSVDSLKLLLLQQVDPVPAWAGLVASGGRLNLFRAASAITPVAPPPPPPGGRTNVALAANGAVANASSTYSAGYSAAGVINGDRRGANWGGGGGWNDGTAGSWPDWLEVAFSGARTISEVDIFSVQDNYQSPAEPTPASTFTLYGLRDFHLEYWTGAAWDAIPATSITGNSMVWRQITFAPVTTTKIRIVVTAALNTWSRIAEVEAYTSGESDDPPPPPPPGTRTNVALATQGAQAAASSSYGGGYGPSGVINGDRRGTGWGAEGGWNDGTASSWPDWIEIQLNGTFQVSEVDVFSVQDNYQSPAEPLPGMTFTQYGLRDFEVQYWTGAGWAPVPGASVAGNTLVWRQFVFAPVSTSRIRVWVTSALQTWSRVTEIEVWTSDEATSPPQPSRSNVALAANGGQAAASSTYSAGYDAAGILNGDREGDGWGNGGGWNDATAGNWPDWVEVGFAGAKTIDQVDVFSVQDTYWAPSEPVAGMTFSHHGLRDFKIQYWTGSAWADVPGASVAGNTLVWRQFTFGPVSTTKIRIWINAAEDSYSRIAEIEVWGQ